jgi:hypothetical protein
MATSRYYATFSNENIAPIRCFQAGNHAQGGCFTASRRSKQDEELTLIDCNIKSINGDNIAESLGDVF